MRLLMQVTLEVHPDTLARFQDAHANLAAWLGYVPPLEWLMAFALDCSDPGDLDETLRQMARDYLRNRRSLD